MNEFREILNQKLLDTELESIFSVIDSSIIAISKETGYDIVNDKNNFCLIVSKQSTPIGKFTYGNKIKEIANDPTNANTNRPLKDRLREYTDLYLRRMGSTLRERRTRELRETQEILSSAKSREGMVYKRGEISERDSTGFILERRGSITNQRSLDGGIRGNPSLLSESLRTIDTSKTFSQTYKITNSYEAVTIPMDEILLKLGYKYKREKSTKRNFTMENENGDLVVISRMPNEHYLYFNPFNDLDKGNIHSFCKNRGVSLKDILHNNTFECNHKLQYTDPKEKNNASFKAVADFEKFSSAKDSDYLEKRGISKNISNSFNIRLDNHNNICFPHYILTELPSIQKGEKNKVILQQSGYTSKLRNPLTKDREGNSLTPNKYIKSICYGNKGLEILKHQELKLSQIENIIITESSIDSLSLFELNSSKNNDIRLDNTLLCATGGNKNEAISKTLQYLSDKTEKNTKFILGMDNDEKGQYFTEQLKEILKGREIIHLEPQLKDFNDDLKAIKILKEGKLDLDIDKNLKQSLEYKTCKILKELKNQKITPQEKQKCINEVEAIKTLKPLNAIQTRMYEEILKGRELQLLR